MASIRHHGYGTRTIDLSLGRLSEAQAAALERTAIVLGVGFGAFPLYHHLTRLAEAYAAHSLATEWDRALPFVPGWAYVYHFVAFASLLPVFVVKDRQLFRRVGLAACIVELTTFIMFFVFPVKMERPELSSTSSFSDWGMQFLYWFDSSYGSFPSLHVSLATLAALCCLMVDAWIGLGAALIALAIAASTLFVKQHFVLDVVFGAALGTVVWLLFVAPARARCRAPSSALRYPRSRVLVVFAIYAVALGALHAAYRARWEPWSGSEHPKSRNGIPIDVERLAQIAPTDFSPGCAGLFSESW